jgi:hypothetical protein
MTSSILLLVLVLLLLLGFTQPMPDDDEVYDPDSWLPDPSWLGDGPVAFPPPASEVTFQTRDGNTFHMRVQPNSDDVKPCEYGIHRKLPLDHPLSVIRIEIPMDESRSPVILDTTSGRAVFTPWCKVNCTTTISWTW